MDDETRAYLVAMEARMLGRMNNQHERLIEEVTALRQDFQSTRGFLLEDAIIAGRRLMTVEQRHRRPGGRKRPAQCAMQQCNMKDE